MTFKIKVEESSFFHTISEDQPVCTCLHLSALNEIGHNMVERFHYLFDPFLIELLIYDIIYYLNQAQLISK